MENERVVVIGGGIIGATTAFMMKLRSPRTKVLLLEKNSGAAQVCSFQNGAVINYSSCDVWLSPSFPYSFFSHLWNSDARVRHNLENLMSPAFWLYALRMLFNCRQSTFEKSSHSLWQLGQRSYLLHQALREQLAERFPEELDSYNFKYPGTLNLFSSHEEYKEAEERGSYISRTLGQNITFYTSRKLCANYEPQIEHIKTNIVGCSRNLLETTASHDSHKLTQAFLNIGRSIGIDVLYDAEVASFQVQNHRVTSLTLTDGRVIEGEHFVVCAGVKARTLGEKLGWKPPIWAVKGYTMNVTSKEHPVNYLLSPHGGFHTYLVPHPGGFRYSYFAEFTSPDNTVIDPVMAEKAEKYLKDYTGFTDLEFSDHWACLRPVSCDDLPIIGKFPRLQNAYLNVGHGSRGSILAFGSAELLTSIVLDEQSPILNPKPYSPDRFYI